MDYLIATSHRTRQYIETNLLQNKEQKNHMPHSNSEDEQLKVELGGDESIALSENGKKNIQHSLKSMG